MQSPLGIKFLLCIFSSYKVKMRQDYENKRQLANKLFMLISKQIDM